MFTLTRQQQDAVDAPGHVLVTACPGSGKTRVLAARVLRGLEEVPDRRGRVAALTFTNRAADEIKHRLDQTGVDMQMLWAGTIHSFALEWILRPYAPYDEETRSSVRVADERYTEDLLQGLRRSNHVALFFEVNTSRDLDGSIRNRDPLARRICREYKQALRQERLLDYDDVLYVAYRMLVELPEIAATLGQIFHLVCVDELQDTQALQYGILSRIARAEGSKTTFFFVGDPKQSIYDDLGAVHRTAGEIVDQFQLGTLKELPLTGNYRSCQRIIDFYRRLHPGMEEIRALGPSATEAGLITFENQTVDRHELHEVVAGRIEASLAEGVAPSDICVLAPQWTHVRAIARRLVQALPEVSFDAPGLSPFHRQADNVWFKLTRLILTRPRPSLMRARVRWAGEVLRDLERETECRIELPTHRARALLRIVNSINCQEEDGLSYLATTFDLLMDRLGIDDAQLKGLRQSKRSFLATAEERLAGWGQEFPRDVLFLRRLFQHPAGVVVSTCHGVKGEEYDTVICFGILRGFIPNWAVIIHQGENEASRATNLLYVVCSRAKRRLHLISETGRYTRGGNPYETTPQLEALRFHYDLA